MRILLAIFVIVATDRVSVAAKNYCPELKRDASIKVSCDVAKKKITCVNGAASCQAADQRIQYEAGAKCILTCATGYLPKPLLKAKDGTTLTQGDMKCTPDTDAAFWTSCESKKCDEQFECVSTAAAFGVSNCIAPATGEIRTTLVVDFPTQQGPYFVTDKASSKRIVKNGNVNPYPSGTFVVHEYTKSNNFVKTCIEYRMEGLSSASNTCVGPGGVTDPDGCNYNTENEKDPKMIQDTRTDCTVRVADANGNVPAPVAGCEYTDYMASNGFKSCSSSASNADDKGCKFHVHTYTVNTQNGIARDNACLGYVGNHYDPLKTSTVCASITASQTWADCEEGDLSGKFNKLSRDTGVANTLMKSTNPRGTFKLNMFTKINGDEGAFSRALVFHTPLANGRDAWFCSALGKSCRATPKDPKKDISAQNPIEAAGFDPDCSVEKTSMLYVWEAVGKKYVMYAGEKDRMVPGRATRLPAIYNILKDPPSGPLPGTIPPRTDGATMASTNTLIGLIFAALTAFAMGF